MLELSEIAAMEDALAAYRLYMEATAREAAKTGLFYPRVGSAGFLVDGIGWVLNEAVFHTGGRAQAVITAQQENLTRFYDRRNELIQAEPSDHEAVLAFVESLRRIAGSDLPQAMAAEREANTLQAIAGGAVVETGKDVARGVGKALDWLPLAVLAVGGLYVLILVRR